MELVFEFLARLLTLLNPCVLPVLPVVMASALGADRRGPLWLVAGMALSFVALGVALARLGPALGIDPEAVGQAAAVVMIAFGLVLLVPALGARFDTAGPGRLMAAGALLGAVWSPCIGPTLGGAIALAAGGEALGQAAAGVAVVMLALAYGARAAIARRQAALRRAAAWAKPVMGGVLVALGAAVLAGLPQIVEGWVLDTLPDWFNDLSIML